MKTLDEQIREAFEALDQSVPESYYDTFPARLEKLLEVKAMEPETPDKSRDGASSEATSSKGKADAVGKDGELGSFQIKKIYVDDVNRIMDATRQQYNRTNRWQFCYEDRKNKHLGRVMTGIYLKHYGGTFEEMARKHNGGPAGHKKESTKAYWQKVKARMENQ